jgi:hypothetical protein
VGDFLLAGLCPVPEWAQPSNTSVVGETLNNGVRYRMKSLYKPHRFLKPVRFEIKIPPGVKLFSTLIIVRSFHLAFPHSLIIEKNFKVLYSSKVPPRGDLGGLHVV